MTNYVLAIPEEPIVYPVTRALLQAKYPTTVLPAAGFGAMENLHVYPVAPSDQPSYDPYTEEVVEIAPELADGQWVQRWEVQELAVPLPVPDWQAFSVALNESAGVRALMSAARDDAPVLFGHLAVGMGQAAQGDNQTLETALGIAASEEMISAELVTELIAMAEAANLPAAFMELLADLS